MENPGGRLRKVSPALLYQADSAGLALDALEYLLNDLSKHGLRVWPSEDGQWCWAWAEQSARADGLDSAITDALH